ncbi:ATP-binding cassette domain-containing protein [Virgibacillus ainsalahensis]
MKAWIEMKGLEKQVDDFHLGPVDLTIEPGTITALVGNNGSGKSTMLKLLMNLVSPDMGSIHISGKSVHGQDEGWKAKVAYHPQTIIGWDAYTGHTLNTLISQLYPNWDEALFNQIIELFEIDLNKSLANFHREHSRN